MIGINNIVEYMAAKLALNSKCIDERWVEVQGGGYLRHIGGTEWPAC